MKLDIDMFTISSIHLYILHHVFPLCKGRSQKGSISVHSVLQILNVGSEIHSHQYMFEKYLHPPHPPIVAVIASIITVALIASTKACHSTSRSFLPLMSGENYENELEEETNYLRSRLVISSSGSACPASSCSTKPMLGPIAVIAVSSA